MKEKVRVYSADDMLAAFLITYAAAVLHYEKNMPNDFMRVYNAVIFIAFAASWLWFCFRNGQRVKIAFPVFTLLFWLLPLLVIFLYNDGPELFRFSIIMYVLSEFLSFLIYTPMEIVGGLLNISLISSFALMLILFAAAYLAGVYMAMKER